MKMRKFDDNRVKGISDIIKIEDVKEIWKGDNVVFKIKGKLF